jgi:hypothetical protein
MIVVTGPEVGQPEDWVPLLFGPGARETPVGDPSASYAHRFNHGVWFATNPGPTAAPYVFPKALVGRVGWMTPGGLLRSDPAYLERVVLATDTWRAASDPWAWLGAVLSVLSDCRVREIPCLPASTSRVRCGGGGARQELQTVRSFLGLRDAGVGKAPGPFPMRRSPGTEGTAPAHLPTPETARVLDELAARLDQRADLPEALVAALEALPIPPPPGA